MKWILEEARQGRLLWDVLDALGLPAFTLDRDFRMQELNPCAQGKLLFSRDDVAGKPVFSIFEPSTAREGLGSLNVFTLEGHCLRKDGESFRARATFVKQEEGGYVAVIEDRGGVERLARRAARRTKEIKTYNALSRTLSQPVSLKEMIGEVLGTFLKAMEVDAAWLYLADEGSGRMTLCAFDGVDERTFEGAKALAPYECFIGRVLSSGRPLLVKNAMEDPRITHLRIREAGIRSIAGVPLLVRNIGDDGNRAVGVLGVASRTENRFSSMDMQFFSAVGSQLGVAVENARLIEKLREKMNQIRLINEISGVVNSSLSIGHIFRLAVSEVKKLIDFDRASITLLDDSENSLIIFTLDTDMPTRLTRGIRAPVRATSAGWAAVNQKAWINADLKERIGFERDRALLEEGIRSTISVPLFKDRPLGSLNFDSKRPGLYTEKDLEILLPVAKHLSIAIENALLFDEISKEKREWEKTFDAITDMVWIEGPDGGVLRANRAVTDGSRYPLAKISGMRTEDLFKALRITGAEGLPAPGLDPGGKYHRELPSATGRVFHFRVYPLFDGDGNLYGRVNYLKDVTEQKRLEQHLFRADKLASLGTLVAGIAHEINNPMGIIAGYSEALLDRASDRELLSVAAFEDFPEYLRTIHNEIFRCKDILKTLLDFARPSTGILREIDLNELIKEVILLVQHKAKRQNQRIETMLERDIPKTAADPGALRQLFMNIIINSFYFMDAEGVITIRTSAEAGPSGAKTILVSISDNGKGMEKETLERIFDPFFTTKPAGEGTGLGLSICHRIVSNHDGTMDVRSVPGKGTTFDIRLPLRLLPARAPEGRTP